MGENSPVFTGIQYVNYDVNIIGTQFYLNERPEPGQLIFNKIEYNHLKFIYDIHLDEVVLIHDSTNYHTIVVKDKLQSFNIKDEHFITVKEDKKRIGIYQMVYSGKNKVLIKRSKRIKEFIKDDKYQKEFEAFDQFFLYDNNSLNEITSKNSLFRLFGDKRKNIKRMMKEEVGLKFKKNTSSYIIKAISIYESL